MPRVKSEAVKKTEVKKKSVDIGKKEKSGGLSVSLFSLSGVEMGIMDLPKELFGMEVNKGLLRQALGVYLNNQKTHYGSTKTRGEVEGSTRKVYRQKGTGNARHGSVRAPIYVGGGVSFGPKYRNTYLELPKKMRIKALISALSQKMLDKEVLGLSGIDKIDGKTKEIANLLKKLNKRSVMVVTDKKITNLQRAVSNLKGVRCLSADQINAYLIASYKSLFLTKEALESLIGRVLNTKEDVNV